MVISLEWLGYGAGLVMLGWFCGQIVAVVFSSIRGLRG